MLDVVCGQNGSERARAASIDEEGTAMGLDDIVNQGKQFLEQNKDKIDEVIHSDKAEEVSDSVLDAAADFVKKVAPDQFDAKVDEVRDQVDGAIGN